MKGYPEYASPKAYLEKVRELLDSLAAPSERLIETLFEAFEEERTIFLVGNGGSVGVAGVLTRSPVNCRATAVGNVRAFHIDPDDLFDVLSNHSDLLQGVFSGVLSGAAQTAAGQPAKRGES